MIKYCPNCKGDLIDKTNLAQHVKECNYCHARYFTIETTAPKILVFKKGPDIQSDKYYDGLNRSYQRGKN